MHLLALESANEHCSVALFQHGTLHSLQHDARSKMQTQVILPMVDQAMQQAQLPLAQLSAIAFSRGPGSFSGVRINATVAQALAWANDLPVISVSTLQALAQAAYRTLGLQQVTAVIDARMNEVYLAHFQCDAQGIAQAISEEQLLSYDVARQHIRFALVGSGAILLDETTPSEQQNIMPTAQDIGTLALAQPTSQWLNAEHALPIYLRNDAWKKIGEQKA
ncbi:MAG: tRNA (adenosine(37)-N6)-threonylcarbamoyltransferase complex dimerization subunit type 1 TsaB [Acinetobacter sp.]|nr:tRNA (adenosine(37)-N6)-threonylcarbamoyltransferase complex dimerization subunit type 1 TsaB [Acinetobacter sp.]